MRATLLAMLLIKWDVLLSAKMMLLLINFSVPLPQVTVEVSDMVTSVEKKR